MKRNLDGYYFRVKRGDGFDNVCFSNLTKEERESVLEHYDRDALIRLACGLADVIGNIGNTFNITGVR